MNFDFDKRNLSLLTDLYQLTMVNGYLKSDMDSTMANFDLFFRSGPWSYAIAAGLEQVVHYIENLHFDQSDLDYLNTLGIFDKQFLGKLKDFKFTGDLRAIPEGTLVFPNEPILSVKAPLFQAQLIETAVLTFINHQTLIATKAERLRQCTSSVLLEFGLRRAQGPDAGIYGARAAYIGGCRSTSNVLAGKLFDIPVKGTHAHSWVMSFDDELTSFRQYAKLYPENCLLLVDTYDTLKSGVPNAIIVFKELREAGYKPVGVRIDSGDLAYLSKKTRQMLDEAGFQDARIYASGDVDEDVLLALNAQGAKIDVYGVGTRLITSYTNPSLGGVYKLSAIEKDGVSQPKMKISDSQIKVTNPAEKKIVRLVNKNGYAVADLICLKDEVIDNSKPLVIYHPDFTWKKTTLHDFEILDLMVDIYKNGTLVYTLPTLSEIGKYEDKSIASFYPEYLRVLNPQEYKVDLSDGLYDLKKTLMTKQNKY